MQPKPSTEKIVPESVEGHCRNCTFAEQSQVFRYNNQIVCKNCLDDIISRKFSRELKSAKCFIPGLYSVIIYNPRKSFFVFLYLFQKYSSHLLKTTFSKSITVICLPSQRKNCEEALHTIYGDIIPEVVDFDYYDKKIFLETLKTKNIDINKTDEAAEKIQSYEPLFDISVRNINIANYLSTKEKYDKIGVIIDPVDSATMATLTYDTAFSGDLVRALVMNEVDQKLSQNIYGERDPLKAFTKHYELFDYPIRGEPTPIGQYKEFHIVRPMKTISFRELEFMIDYVLVPKYCENKKDTLISTEEIKKSLYLDCIEESLLQSHSIECILSSTGKLIMTPTKVALSVCPICGSAKLAKKGSSEEKEKKEPEIIICKYCAGYLK